MWCLLGIYPFLGVFFLRLIGSLLSHCNHRLKKEGTGRFTVTMCFYFSSFYRQYTFLFIFFFFFFFFFFFSYLLLSIHWDRFFFCFVFFFVALGVFHIQEFQLTTICAHVTNAPEAISNFLLE